MAIPYAGQAYDPRGSRIADLIIAAGNARARGVQARGEIMGNAIGSLGQIAAQAFKEREEEKRLAPIRAAQMQALQQGNELQGLQIADAKKKRTDEEMLSTALGYGVDESFNIDPKRVAEKLKSVDRPDLMQHALGLINERQAAIQAIESRSATAEEHARNLAGGYAQAALAFKDPNERQAFIQHILPTFPKAGISVIQPYLERVGNGEMDLDSALDAVVKSSPAWQKQQMEIAAKNSEQKIVAPNSAIVENGVEKYRNTVAEKPIVVGRDLVDPKTYKVLHTAPATPRVDPLVSITGDDGKPVLVRESDAVGRTPGQTKTATGKEQNDLGFYRRAKQASDDLAGIEDKMRKQGLLDQGRLKSGVALIQNSDQQMYTQAQRAFTEARLRKESGAAIPASEYANDARTYFVQPGDTKEVVEQKKRAREVVLSGLAIASGKAFDQYYGESFQTPANSSSKKNPFRK